MARRRARSRSAGLAGALLLAGTASGKVVSLSSVTAISSAPLNCTLAYNAPILGCGIGDFSRKTCSQLCRQSIDGIQISIQASCNTTQASRGSLLFRAQQGDLFAALCGIESNGDTGLTASRSTIPIAVSSTPSETITRTPPTSITPTISTTSATSVRTEPSSDSVPPDPTATLSPLQTSAETSAEQGTSTSSEARSPTLQPGSGGGSPFDFAVGVSPAPRKQLSITGIAVGWALAVLLMQ